MTGWGLGKLPKWDDLTKEAFWSIVRDRDFYVYWCKFYGRKPTVRVKAGKP